MKWTLNRTDRCNKYTHAEGVHVIYVKSIYVLLKLRKLSVCADHWFTSATTDSTRKLYCGKIAAYGDVLDAAVGHLVNLWWQQTWRDWSTLAWRKWFIFLTFFLLVLSIHIMCFNTVFRSKISTEGHLVCICVPGHTKYILRAVPVLSTRRQGLTDCDYWRSGMFLIYNFIIWIKSIL